MMTSTSQASESKHPLLADRERLEEILDIMYAKIQRTLFPGNPRRRPRAETGGFINADDRERIREGAGFSADDVLSEAFFGLLEYSPERLKGTWESLAVTIAGNKAADAFRASTKGLRGTDHRPELRIVSGDAEGKGPDGEREPALFEVLPSNCGDPEAEYLELEYVLKLRDLVRKVLDDREQDIFFAIHFDGYSRKEVGDRLGLTSQRIGQIYKAALSRLETHPDYPSHPFKLDN